jgi:hypothetical protein
MTRSIKNMMIISLATVLIFAAAGIAAPLDEPGDPGSDAGGAIPRGAKNLFLKAACTADKVWSNRTPDLAVNGNRRAGDHWAGPPIPAKHTVDLKTPAKFNTIRMITYFDRRRSYQYFVEISTDGKAWKQIIDQSKNKAKATAAGRVFKFEPVTARYIRTTFTGNSQDNNSGGHIVEIEGYMIDPSAKPKPVVNATPLSGATGSVNQRYQRDSKPQLPDSKKWSTVAWRGERVHGQFVVWTGSDLKNVSLTASELKSAGGKTIPAADVIPFFVRYTMGAGQLLGDILEPNRPIDLPKNSTRPIWVSVNVPQNTVPGVYKGTLAVKGAAGNSITFEISIDVLPNVLPAPKQWSFHLDLWQNPWAVSRIRAQAVVAGALGQAEEGADAGGRGRAEMPYRQYCQSSLGRTDPRRIRLDDRPDPQRRRDLDVRLLRVRQVGRVRLRLRDRQADKLLLDGALGQQSVLPGRRFRQVRQDHRKARSEGVRGLLGAAAEGFRQASQGQRLVREDHNRDGRATSR